MEMDPNSFASHRAISNATFSALGLEPTINLAEIRRDLDLLKTNYNQLDHVVQHNNREVQQLKRKVGRQPSPSKSAKKAKAVVNADPHPVVLSRHFVDTTNFEISTPKVTLPNSSSRTAACPSCGQLFAGDAKRKNYSLAYYEHCIKHCEKHKAHGKVIDVDERTKSVFCAVAHCYICQMSFLNKNSLGKHIKAVHERLQKPEWMTQESFVAATRSNKPDTIKCSACGAMFWSKTKGHRVEPELRYYIHCIELCAAYRAQNLITKCGVCDKLFLNKLACESHNRRVHNRRL